MKEKRMYVQCDRCKKEISLRETDVEIPGATAQTLKLKGYESMPEGWESIDGKDFCPDCARKYHNLMENFYGK